MPHGARTPLAALIMSLALAAPAAWAEPGSTWTDPPARKPAPVTSPAEARTPAPPSASTPAASTTAAKAPVAARKAVAARSAPQRMATHRAAPAPESAPLRVAAHRARVAAAPARIARPHRMVTIAPPPPPQSRYWSYGYGPGYGSGYADDRLERLRAAEAAGYMVVRRRTVEYPDGRSRGVAGPDAEGDRY